MRLRAALALALVAGCAAATATPAVRRHAIVVSIDGLMPESILRADGLGLRIPVLRALARAGRLGSSRPAFPTVTYPNHTTMATGVWPARHGIVSNLRFDPEEKNQDGWFWYAEDVRAPAIWDVARRAGRRVALIGWPVTVGAVADVVVPEIWRAGTPDDQKLLRALSTPGFLTEVAGRFPDLWTLLTPPATKDAAVADIAVVALAKRPDLLMVHIFETDDAQHAQGPRSPEALRAIDNADTQLGRIIEAARAAGTWDTTLLLVVSDHGFMPVTRAVRPGAYLREAGLVTLDERGKVASWRASVVAAGGAALVYVADDASRAKVAELFARLAATPGSGIGRVYSREELAARGADPAAAVGLEASEGTTFLSGHAGPASEPTTTRGTHGYDAARPEMAATFLLVAPGVTPGPAVDVAQVDVAPTVAEWLGLPLPGVDGSSRLSSWRH